MNLIRCFFVVYLMAIGFTLIAQNPYYTNFDTKDGLPSSEVYDIEVDQNGLVWITTDRGVCTFDGYQFKTYTTKDGLADNTNFEIYRDSKNRLWFNGYNGKISYFEKGRFHPYKHNEQLTNILSGSWVSEIFESYDSVLMFVVNYIEQPVAYSFDKTKAPIRLEPKVIDQSNNNQIKDKFYGVFDSNISFYTILKNYSSPNRLYSSVAIKQEDYWFFTTYNSVYKSDHQGNIIQKSIIKNGIGDFVIDDKKNLWISTNKGLYKYVNSDLSKNPELYFKNENISSISTDSEGNYWVSTIESGIYLVPSFDIKGIEMNAGENEKYLSIGKLEKQLFIGTSFPKLITIDSNFQTSFITFDNYNTYQIRHIVTNKSNLALSNGYNIYTHGNEIVKKKRVTHIGLIIKTLKNGIDIFGQNNTLRFLKNNKTFYSSQYFDKPFIERPTVISQSENEDIWIGTITGLFTIKDYNYQKCSRVDSIDLFGRVNDIFVDGYDNIWVATIGNGLFYKTNNKTYNIGHIDGLNSDIINHILITNDSIVWVATNRGLNQFSYSLNSDSLVYSKIKSLTISDGLSSNFINDIDFWNNEIWLATNDGICHFKPDIINRKFPPVQVLINNFIVNDSIYNIEESLVLNHDENDIFISFTGISFRKNKNTSFYKYRLILGDEDTEWFYTNEKNIRYNDLSPGAYTFEVLAKNKTGQWNTTHTSYSFRITPHYSDTFWFRLLLTTILLLLLGSLAYIQYRRIKNRQIEKLKLQEAELRFREAELSSLRNQMNPHFVHNALNSIQNFIFRKDVEKANHYLSMFSKLMRNSLEYSRLKFITVEEEINYLKNYLALESMRFPGKFEVDFIIEQDLPINYIKIPSLLIQPIVENVVKHAFKDLSYKGKLTLNIGLSNEVKLEISILDNGPGFSNRLKIKSDINKHESLGLEIINDRFKLLNEEFETDKFEINFINIADIDNEETGVKVVFLIPIYQDYK